MKRWLIPLAVLAAVGCRRDDRVVVPNRVLDRPLDVVLGCVRLDENDGRVHADSLNACASTNSEADAPRCDDDNSQLIGFIANSERNEVAMFRRCDFDAALVDLDPDVSGYNFVPVGELPSAITATERACRVVTSNAGSCDLSVLDGRRLGGYALDVDPEVAPSALVSRLIPVRSDGQPLASRPGEIMAVPRRLSLAETVGGGDDDDAVDTDTDTDGGDITDDLCPEDRAASVWVAFPSCQMVAEISLVTQRILQSRQFLNQTDGTVLVVDSGTVPDCPIDCPGQFEGDLPARDPYIADGFFPSTIALIEAIRGEDVVDVDSRVNHSVLYVGGTGSDTIVEIGFAVDEGDNLELGEWEGDVQVQLENAGGVHVIRPTPAMAMFGQEWQFLYAVAGDGSTHVVSRDFSRGNLGVECDTQLDPTVAPPSGCNEIVAGAAGAPDRRPFAIGPGIREQFGATINDWTFQRTEGNNTDVNAQGRPNRSPFAGPGVVGIGVTSFGNVVYSVFGQYESDDPGIEGFNTVQVMRADIRPHSLWPGTDPDSGGIDALPLAADAEVGRALPGPEDSAQVLAPSLRLIDFAYADFGPDIEVTDERQIRGVRLGSQSNADGLGLFEDGLYSTDSIRAAVRDYQLWSTQAWTMTWEGEVSGTNSSTGRIECDTPGWENGTCLRLDCTPDSPGEEIPAACDENPEDDLRLIDEGATFCDNGVLAGDKLVVLGCNADEDCGLGQACLREPTAPGNASGICMSEQAVEQQTEEMRQICAPFIADPCGPRRREYVITRAFQNKLYFSPLAVGESSHVRLADPEDPQSQILELAGRYVCVPPYVAADGQPDGGCTTHAECESLGGGPNFVCDQGVCREQLACSADEDCGTDEICSEGACRDCPGGEPGCTECTDDLSCAHFGPTGLCIDGVCRRQCEVGEPDCWRAAAPGPRCFSELVRYGVRVRNSFVVSGEPQARFLANQVLADPSTAECRIDPTVSNLLTSRLWLGADEDETFNHPDFGIPDCVNADEASPSDPNPCRITVPREMDETSLFHYFTYGAAEPTRDVAAIRFSNPFMSIVLDLTSLTALADPPELFPTQRWPDDFATYRRARIPRGYRQEFDTEAGFNPFRIPIVVGNTETTYPVRIINGPTPGVAFVVDAGGRGGRTGVRGQVARIKGDQPDNTGDPRAFTDQDFRVR